MCDMLCMTVENEVKKIWYASMSGIKKSTNVRYPSEVRNETVDKCGRWREVKRKRTSPCQQGTHTDHYPNSQESRQGEGALLCQVLIKMRQHVFVEVSSQTNLFSIFFSSQLFTSHPGWATACHVWQPTYTCPHRTFSMVWASWATWIDQMHWTNCVIFDNGPVPHLPREDTSDDNGQAQLLTLVN